MSINKIYGYFDVKKSIVFIDKSLIDTDRFSFLLAHEIGHFFLHSNLKINQTLYDNFKESEYNFLTDKHDFMNYKNWIEWQANYFASCLIMPKEVLINLLISFQKELGTRTLGHIFLDDQPINISDFKRTINSLSRTLKTTKTSIIYRLQQLELITYSDSVTTLGYGLKEYFTQNSTNFFN